MSILYLFYTHTLCIPRFFTYSQSFLFTEILLRYVFHFMGRIPFSEQWARAPRRYFYDTFLKPIFWFISSLLSFSFLAIHIYIFTYFFIWFQTYRCPFYILFYTHTLCISRKYYTHSHFLYYDYGYNIIWVVFLFQEILLRYFFFRTMGPRAADIQKKGGDICFRGKGGIETEVGCY